MRKRPTFLSMNWARDHYCAELLTLINYCSVGFWGRGPCPLGILRHCYTLLCAPEGAAQLAEDCDDQHLAERLRIMASNLLAEAEDIEQLPGQRSRDDNRIGFALL